MSVVEKYNILRPKDECTIYSITATIREEDREGVADVCLSHLRIYHKTKQTGHRDFRFGGGWQRVNVYTSVSFPFVCCRLIESFASLYFYLCLPLSLYIYIYECSILTSPFSLLDVYRISRSRTEHNEEKTKIYFPFTWNGARNPIHRRTCTGVLGQKLLGLLYIDI